MNSLDPRVKRLTEPTLEGPAIPKPPLDQFGTFEVFVQPKPGKPFQHEGIVHAPNLEMAFILAKEAFTRRFTCTSLYVADTGMVFVSSTTEQETNAYDGLINAEASSEEKVSFEIYHLPKRGKQHIHAGTVQAGSPQEALAAAARLWGKDKIVYNVWAIRTSAIRFTLPEEQDLWITLPEKKFRDAADYKGGDKLKNFLESRNR